MFEPLKFYCIWVGISEFYAWTWYNVDVEVLWFISPEIKVNGNTLREVIDIKIVYHFIGSLRERICF